MTPENKTDAGQGISPEMAEEMAKYGITSAPFQYFYYGDYRYTNLRDAIAQAKRTSQAT